MLILEVVSGADCGLQVDRRKYFTQLGVNPKGCLLDISNDAECHGRP